MGGVQGVDEVGREGVLLFHCVGSPAGQQEALQRCTDAATSSAADLALCLVTGRDQNMQ